jgi:hypothetical protein
LVAPDSGIVAAVPSSSNCPPSPTYHRWTLIKLNSRSLIRVHLHFFSVINAAESSPGLAILPMVLSTCSQVSDGCLFDREFCQQITTVVDIHCIFDRMDCWTASDLSSKRTAGTAEESGLIRPHFTFLWQSNHPMANCVQKKENIFLG